MPTSIEFPIETTLRNINTPKANTAANNFLSNGGQVIMTNDTKSLYQSGGHVNSNGLEKNGTIFIGAKSVDAYADTMDIPLVWAAKALLVHELGHVAYQQYDYIHQPGDNAPMAQKVDWCLDREAEATFFSFAVAVEDHAQGGNLFVPGTEAVPDLYSAMLAATAGANPLSFDYEKKGIAFAKNLFSHDKGYVDYCSNPDNWKKPAYVTPNTSEPDWGSGGGGGGHQGGASGGYTPQPGGYWKKPPIDVHPSDSTAPTPGGYEPVQVVGINTHAGLEAHAAY